MVALTLLETHGLTRHFGGIKAVDNVDFSLHAGSIRALIGPNGAGKTTLTSLICGRVGASSGKVFFNGSDITRLPAHRRIRAGMSYTFQITSIFPEASVYENVMLSLQRRKSRSGKSLKSRAYGVLELVGLHHYRHQKAGDLSYGHKRLLEIAMGLAQKPKLLILDEPTQGLAGGEINGFIHLIKDVAAEMTVLLIEHNMDVVMALAEEITVMDQGRIIAEGTPAEIRANSDVQEAYLGV